MPGKSRRGKGKYVPYDRKRKGSVSRPTIAAQQPAVGSTREPLARPGAPTPSATIPASRAKAQAVQYPYVTRELRTIGILAGIMLVILIVLSRVLS